MSLDGGHQEGDFEEPQADSDELHPPVGAGDDDQGQEYRRCRYHHRRGHSDQAGDAGDSGELGDQGSDRGHPERGHREQGPTAAESLLDQLGMPLAGGDAEPRRQLHDQVEHRNEHHLEGQKPVAPLGHRIGQR